MTHSPLVIGVDPGRSAGLALMSATLGKPQLRACWNIYGYDTPWRLRLLDALEQLPPVRSRVAVAAIEVPPNGGRSHRFLGSGTWASLMLRVGLIQARLEDLGWECSHVSALVWPRDLGCRKGKGDNPLVRIDEASRLVRGFAHHVEQLPGRTKADWERRVCAAEASLIAAWRMRELLSEAA